jgi:hypothetical protein
MGDKDRGIVCMFCGEGFGYSGEKPDEQTMKAAVDHEKECPENPYTKRIKFLETALSIAVEGLCVIKTFNGKAAVAARQRLFVLESLKEK